jgi:iron complex transport system permease protein
MPSEAGRRYLPFWRVLLFGSLLLLAAVAAGVRVGAADLSWDSVEAALTGTGSEHVMRVVWSLRLPRVLLGALAGVHFALAGWLLQIITRNPLADPGILGISGGASLAAVAAFLVGDWLIPGVDPYRREPLALAYLPLVAMLGGLLAALAIYRLSGAATLTPLRLTLTGAVLAALLHALATGVLALWGHAHTEVVVQWLAGSLHGHGWPHLRALAPWSGAGLLALLLMRRPLAVLRLQDEHGYSLGLEVARWRRAVLLLAAVLAASAVGAVGPIGFLGLVVPHMARRLVGPRLDAQLVACAMLGAVLAVAADTAGRVLLVPYELPVGVVCALLGAPFFLYLLHRQA